MNDDDLLVRDLTRLGRTLPSARPPPVSRAPSSNGSRRCRHRSPTLRRSGPVPSPGSGRGGGGSLVAVLALLVALLATPPVRAAVSDWFGFAGVIVARDPAAGRGRRTAPARGRGRDDGRRGRRPGRFHSRCCPTSSATPSAVDVSADRVIVSMTWSTDDGPVRLDQFDGRLDCADRQDLAGRSLRGRGGGRRAVVRPAARGGGPRRRAASHAPSRPGSRDTR